MKEVGRQECIDKLLEWARKKGMRLPKGIERDVGIVFGEYYDGFIEAGFKIVKEEKP